MTFFNDELNNAIVAMTRFIHYALDHLEMDEETVKEATLMAEACERAQVAGMLRDAGLD